MSFYKLQGDELLIAPTVVTFPTGQTLVAADHATYTYPAGGWSWFDTDGDAYDALGRSERDDVQIVVKSSGGVRLFGIRFNGYGVEIVNFSNNAVLIDGSGGTALVVNLSLASGAARHFALVKPLVKA